MKKFNDYLKHLNLKAIKTYKTKYGYYALFTRDQTEIIKDFTSVTISECNLIVARLSLCDLKNPLIVKNFNFDVE
jgi:hypothetical protein